MSIATSIEEDIQAGNLEPGQALWVEASLRREDGQSRLTAQKIEALDERAARACNGFCVFLASDIALPALKGVLDRERLGSGRLRLAVPVNGKPEALLINLKGRYAVSPAARAAIKAVPGVIDVHDL